MPDFWLLVTALSATLASGHSTFHHFSVTEAKVDLLSPEPSGTWNRLLVTRKAERRTSNQKPWSMPPGAGPSTRSGRFVVGFWRHEPSGTQARKTSNQKPKMTVPALPEAVLRVTRKQEAAHSGGLLGRAPLSCLAARQKPFVRTLRAPEAILRARFAPHKAAAERRAPWRALSGASVQLLLY